MSENWNLYPHGSPASGRLARAREVLSEELNHLAEIEDKISAAPGTPPGCHPRYLLGRLQGLAGFLLLALEETDASAR